MDLASERTSERGAQRAVCWWTTSRCIILDVCDGRRHHNDDDDKSATYMSAHTYAVRAESERTSLLCVYVMLCKQHTTHDKRYDDDDDEGDEDGEVTTTDRRYI